jgi:hypothetical protein
MDISGWVLPIGFCSVLFFTAWKFFFFPHHSVRSNKKLAIVWFTVMTACAIALFAVLRTKSSADVRDDVEELVPYFLFSLVVVAVAQGVLAVFGVSVRDDVAERRNASASFAAAGFTLGSTCCVAGSNIGNGPGFEVVLFCVALATGTLLTSWIIFAALTGGVDTITVERDLGAGIRVGAWLAGCGAVLGASIAGDWHSVSATLRDFAHFGWPLVPSLFLLVMYERRMARTVAGQEARMLTSVFLAVIFLVAAATYTIWIGRQG